MDIKYDIFSSIVLIDYILTGTLINTHYADKIMKKTWNRFIKIKKDDT